MDKSFLKGISLPAYITKERLLSCEHFAGNEKFIKKAVQQRRLEKYKFDITCDCEDGAESGSEVQQIEMIIDVVRSFSNEKFGIRIHNFESPWWKQEIESFISALKEQIEYITIPKVKNYETIRIFSQFIKETCIKNNYINVPSLHVLIETPGALREIWEIAHDPLVRVLDFGIMDYVSEFDGAIPLSAIESPGQFEHPLIVQAKCNISFAAACAGIAASHNVTLAVNDSKQVFSDAKTARLKFGFIRMWSIHPNQIAPIIEGMKPDNSELDLACKVLEAASKTNWAPVSYQGKLYDKASYRYLSALVNRAE